MKLSREERRAAGHAKAEQQMQELRAALKQAKDVHGYCGFCGGVCEHDGEMKLPHTYCITLSQTPQRTEAARKQFARLGLDVEMVYGIHGETAKLQPVQGHLHRLTNPNEVALTMNHWMVWAMAQSAGHDEVLVLEDDVLFNPDFKTRYAAAYAALPDDWDVVYLGHARLPTSKVTRINEHVSKVEYPACTHATLLRGRVLAALRDQNEQFVDTIDVSLMRNSLPFVNAYCIDPVIAAQKTHLGLWPSLLEEEKYPEMACGRV